MTTYILYSNGVIEKDGFYIPIDQENQDFIDYLGWLSLGNTPTTLSGSVYLAKIAAQIQDKELLKQEYQNMIARLDQIQTVSNPTNAQVVSAVKDEALYIERIAKLIKSILT